MHHRQRVVVLLPPQLWIRRLKTIHILAQIPAPESRKPLTKKSLLKSAANLYSPDYVTNLRQQFERAEAGKDPKSRELMTQLILDHYGRRRGNLSEFMKDVKQRIAHYINKQYKRTGTLWDGRFKSPIVERTLEAILAVSTYIDLNSVRAGIVERPEKYRWCCARRARTPQRWLATEWRERDWPVFLP